MIDPRACRWPLSRRQRLVRWSGGHKLFTSSKLKTGDVILIQRGKIVKAFTD